MAYRFEVPTADQVSQWSTDGSFNQLWEDSKDYVNSGNQPFAEDVTDNQKRDYFITRFQATYSGFSTQPANQTLSMVAAYDDEKLIGIYMGYINSDDTSWNLVLTLFSPNKAGSRGYIYDDGYTSGLVALWKSLSCDRLIIWTSLGTQMAFRAASNNTYNKLSNCYEPVIIEENVEIHHYYKRPAFESPPDFEGNSVTVPEEVVYDYYTTENKFTLVFK